VTKEVELRRHTDADEYVLTAEGVAAALAIGALLRGGYHLAVSTGAQRATQTLACFLAALGQRVPGGVVVEPGLRSQVEDRWRAAYQKAGSGTLEALREADPELVATDSRRLGAALRRVLDALPRAAAPSSSATARPTRPPSSASPARSRRRSQRAPASSSSSGTTATRSNSSSKDCNSGYGDVGEAASINVVARPPLPARGSPMQTRWNDRVQPGEKREPAEPAENRLIYRFGD
jgi:hypothetical protein